MSFIEDPEEVKKILLEESEDALNNHRPQVARALREQARDYNYQPKDEETYHCHRCGADWLEHQVFHANGVYCPNCPKHKDEHASLSY